MCMECHLCQYCGAITNIPVEAPCEESPTGEHEWVTGDEVEDQVRMIWERTPASLTNTSD